jgi:hypothetical protein
LTTKEIPRSIKGIRGGKMITEARDDKTFTLIGRCIVTDHIMRIVVPKKELFNFCLDPKQSIHWFESIKNDLGLREFLISGISPAGWNRMWGDDDK